MVDDKLRPLVYICLIFIDFHLLVDIFLAVSVYSKSARFLNGAQGQARNIV